MLHPNTSQLIANYLSLPFLTDGVRCPYFNNRRTKVRGALRVLVGKGRPEEIVEEAKLFALREKINLKNFNSEQLENFLSTHHLGVDCSGLAYHLLDSETKAQRQKNLRAYLHFPFAKTPWRKLLAKLRPAENAGTRTLAHTSNSTEISISKVAAGDIIIMLDGPEIGNPNHILFIHERTENVLHYTHALNWKNKTDQNGVRQGTIKITDENKNLLEQVWQENDCENATNETYARAGMAKTLSIRRLNCLKNQSTERSH